MPTYDYLCDRCGPLEVFQSIKADSLKLCPECGSRAFQKQVSVGAGVIFKGSGFWETDYNRSDSYKDAAKKESGGDSKSAGSEPAGGDKAGSDKPAASADKPATTSGGSATTPQTGTSAE